MIKIEHVKNGYGYKVIQDNAIIGYYGEYAQLGACEGVVYKDFDAWESGQGVCYINEYGFDNSEQNASELFQFSAKKSATKNGVVDNPYYTDCGYTKQDILSLADGNENMANELFDRAEWQAIETLLYEWEDYE